jgi:hypothetical protein
MKTVWAAALAAGLSAIAIPLACAHATVVWGPEYERHLTIDVVVHPDGSHVDTATIRVKRLTGGTAPNGDQISQLIPLDAAYTRLRAIRAARIDASGNRHELPPDAIKTSPMRDGLMTGVETGELTQVLATGIGIDDALEVSASFEGSARLPGQFMYRLPKQVLCGSVRIAFHVPKTMQLSYVVQGLQLNKTDDGANDLYESAIPQGEQKPGPCASGANIAFDLIATSVADYEELARRYGEWIAGSDTVPEAVRQLADTITQGVEDRRQQAVLLHDWVAQNLALTGPDANMNYGVPGRASYFLADIDWGIGARMPHPFQRVIEARKASALDQVLVYRALLKAKKIEAELVLLNGGQDFSLPAPATLYPFTAAMVWLPEFAVYDDVSAGTAPFGTLAFLDYGKPVLHVGGSGPALRRTPMLGADQASLSVSTTVTLAMDGSSSGTSRATATGPFVVTFGDIAAAIHAEGGDAPDGLDLRWHPKHARFSFEPGGPATPVFTIVEEFSSPPPARSAPISGAAAGPAGNPLFLDIGGGSGLHGLEDQLPIANNSYHWSRGVHIFGARVPKPGEILLEPAEMTAPLFGWPPESAPFTCIPGRYTEDLSIHFAGNERPQSWPPDADISNDDVAYTARWSFDHDTLKVHRVLVSKVPGPASCGAKDEALVQTVLQRVNADFEPPISLVQRTGGARE